ncbi:hypothetical protein D3C71_2045140 [compost metagenome]
MLAGLKRILRARRGIFTGEESVEIGKAQPPRDHLTREEESHDVVSFGPPPACDCSVHSHQRALNLFI